MINLIAMDVYDGTPTIVTVWLTIVVKLTILIFLLSIIEYTIPDFMCSASQATIYNSINIFNSASNIASNVPLVDAGESNSFYSAVPAFVGELIEKEEIKNLFLISSLLSLLIGTVAGLSQIKFKRLLAFSSISHVGFLLLALGVYTQKSIDSFLFYLLQYSVTSLNIFLILLAFSYFIIMPTNGINTFSSLLPDKLTKKEESISATLATHKKDLNDNVGSLTDINYIVELKGQIYKNPVLSISMAICLFSMAGVPPLIGFFSKQFVLFSSIENGYNFLSIVAILVSVISASYYLKLIKITFFDYLPSLKKNTIYLLPSFYIKAQGHNAVATFATQEAVAPQQKQDKIWFLCAVSEIHSYIIAILTFLILFFFLDPSILLNVTQLISLTIFNI